MPARFSPSRAFRRGVSFSLWMPIFAAAILIIHPLARAGAATETPPAATQDPAAGVSVERMLQGVRDGTFQTLWSSVSRLVRYGRLHGEAVLKPLRAALKSGGEKMRLASARALCQLKHADWAGPVLRDLVAHGRRPVVRSQAATAIGLTLPFYGDQATADALLTALEKETDPGARIVIARTLWRISSRAEAKHALTGLMRGAAEKAIRDEATLTLAGLGFLVAKDAWIGRPDERLLKELYIRIVDLSLEPTAHGERALNLFRALEDVQERHANARVTRGFRLLREILERIRTAHPDEGKFLFALEAAWKKDFEKPSLSEALRKVLKEKGVTLSSRAHLARQEEGRWVLSDPGKQAYVVEEHEGALRVYKKQYDLETLFENASKGMVSSLDPFSQYLDREEVKATREMLRQDYGGIGAYVGLRNGMFTVISPIYGSPADRAGLKSMDTILEVEGVKTSSLLDKGGMSKVISRLKGKPGTPVRVKFYRRGFRKAKEITIVRNRIKIQSVYAALLPGKIGYVRLTRFGERTSRELSQALAQLQGKGKARGIILDLRDNPGGLLRTGVEVADRFLAGGKLIVYSKGRKAIAPRRSFYSTGGKEDEAFPLVMLVNSGSASASEIVAGCLMEFKRAPLVGSKTYGKGSVQQIIPLRATGRETQLRLTIAKYYLPSGRSIHEQGIEVDVPVKPKELDDWSYQQIFALRGKRLCEAYVNQHWKAHKAQFLLLAEDDGEQTGDYPEFEAFYKSLDSYRLKRDLVRAEVRRVVRRLAQDELHKEFVCDLESDIVLQRGVLEMLKKLKLDPATLARYRGYPEKFKKKEAEKGLHAELPKQETQEPSGGHEAKE